MEVGTNQLYQEKKQYLEKLKQNFLFIYKESEDLLKENVVIYNQYNLVFGKHYYRRYELYCFCERLKRKLELCQVYLNKEEEIDENQVEITLDREFEEYLKRLQLILDEYNNAVSFNNLPNLSDLEIKEIKRIYIKIAKAIHPDVNLNITEDDKKLWQKALNAYKINDLKTLKECEFYLDIYHSLPTKEITSIDVIEQEIKKYIAKIASYQSKNDYLRNSFPYDQKELLQNEIMIQVKLKEVQDDIILFTERLNHLETMLSKILPKNEYIC